MPWVGWPPAETGRDRWLAEADRLQQVRIRVSVRVRFTVGGEGEGEI